jgi:oligopeptide/dipeptide ABC transporter ATP-binding protein
MPFVEPAIDTLPTSAENEALLSLRELKTHFFTDSGVVRAVDGVTLRVRAGETLAIVGESGSGKSVTGLSIMRLLARTTARIVGGEILLRKRDGDLIDLAGLPEDAMERVRGRDIAMIFQDPMSSLNPVFTIGDQIAEPIRLHHRLDRRAAMLEAVRLLEQVGISDPEKRVHSYPHQLSGGMRQRVMIAIALAAKPRLLIADEPTTALDVTIQAQIVALLKHLQRLHGMAMIFITHDLKLVAEVADRVAVMYASEVVEEGLVAEVLARPRHPYTRALMDCIPRRDYEAPGQRRLKPIPGLLPDPLSPPPGCRFHARCEFGRQQCAAGRPALEQIGERHAVRCIRWREIPL